MKLLLHTSSSTLSEPQRDELVAISPGLEVKQEPITPPDKLAGEGVTILVTDQVPRNLPAWPDLRWVQLLSAGANQLQGHPILETAIPVTTASGTHGVPIGQFVTCTWLMMVHRMPEIFAFKSTRNWPNRLGLAGSSVRGLTAGIVGYGSIGRECARQLQMLGMRVVCLKRDPSVRKDEGYNAWSGTGDPDGDIPEAWFAPGQLREMLPQCDLVVVTVPGTPQTEGMIGRDEFSRLRKGARMIIVSRGGIVVEEALAESLRNGQLAGAVVDCYVKEPPPPDHIFFDTPNLIMVPHMSGVYDAFWPAMLELLRENLSRFQKRLPLLNQVRRDRGY